MSNVITLVWNFDKILIGGYMEELIFEYYRVNNKVFGKK